jgi:hypothetical protein
MIAPTQVVSFKAICKENAQIADLIAREFLNDIEAPVLDVGAGAGDIASTALAAFDVTLLDLGDFSHFPVASPRHRRVFGDFFHLPIEQLSSHRTLLLTHVLQFLDADLEILNSRIRAINPTAVLIVLNTNDAFMGELVDWFAHRFPTSNPEVDHKGFLPWMKIKKEIQFEAIVPCASFGELARQVSYLMDYAPTEEELSSIKDFLKKYLSTPSLVIRQAIRLYHGI